MPPPAYGQAVAPAGEYVHEAWTVQDGLPVNAVNAVLQEARGYLWLATWDGLVRFDGVRFTVFSTGNSEGLPSNRIVELAETPDGSLWLRTGQNHLVRRRDGEFTHIGPQHGVRDGSVRVLHVNAQGVLWIATEQGVHRFEEGRFVRVAEHAIHGTIESLLHTAAGTLWVGTRQHGLFRVSGHTATRFDTTNGLASDWVTALREDRAGNLWIGTGSGVHRYRDGSLERLGRENGLSLEAPIRELYSEPPGDRIWVASEHGLYMAGGNGLRTVLETPDRLSLPTVRFEHSGTVWYSFGDRLYRDGRLVFQVPARTVDDEHAIPEIHTFTWDHEGSLWIGTHSLGLHRLKPAVFRVYSRAEGLPHHNVATVLEDSEGALWAGTMGHGLARIREAGITRYTPAAGYPAFATALLQDDRGDLWVGTHRQGIFRCRLQGMVCAPAPGSLPDAEASVAALHQDATGRLLAGTDIGLFRSRNGVWERLTGAEGLQASIVRVFHQARDGTLWMGTSGSGVIGYRQGRFSTITSADGLPSELIRALYEDAHGRLWVGTEGRGLARVTSLPRRGPQDPARHHVVAYRQRDGLFDEVIHQILEDDYGRLWMSSNRGIFWVRLEELEAFAEGRIPRIHSTAYTERDGLRNREANGGFHPAGVRGRDGRLWFPTQDGVAVVDPSDIRRNEAPPPVVIERLLARDREVRAGAAAVALRAGERNFEIDYTALSLMAPENVRFRYRLEGLTEEWIDAGNRRTAFFTNVPPGSYTFRVVASNNDGVWNETGSTLALSVAPRFLETSAARLLLAFTAGLAALLGFRWRVRSLRVRERELTALVATRTAELRRNEEQLEHQNARLERQARELTELDQAKSRFFANLSHEFRTPLTLIVGPVKDLLAGRHGLLPPSAHQQHELVLRNSHRLLRLINQILDLARLDSGETRLERRAADVAAAARACVGTMAPLAARRRIGLECHAPPELLIAWLDPDAFEKALLNLLSNALKFTDPGGRVTVTVVAAEESAEVAVRDTGIGIAAEELPRIFDRFHQVDSSATRRHEGSGIGLALAKELVELHGGTLSVESTPGEGSTFTIRLPLAEPAAPGEDESAPTPPATEPRRQAVPVQVWVESGEPAPAVPDEASAEDDDADRTSVLVVDDNADIRSFVRSILEPGFRVAEAADGEEGLARARELLPDLIVADVMMPRLDGLALARALKQDAATDCIPVILLTARATPADELAGLETGVDDYVVKPFDGAVLEARVANLIALRQRLRERFRAEGVPPALPTSAEVQRSAWELALRALVESHLTEPDFSPEALAVAAGHTYPKLYRRLRDELGFTPTRFIRAVRVERAAELLAEGAGSVTEVAYGVGFNSLSHFHRSFRERFGGSPSEVLHRAS